MHWHQNDKGNHILFDDHNNLRGTVYTRHQGDGWGAVVDGHHLGGSWKTPEGAQEVAQGLAEDIDRGTAFARPAPLPAWQRAKTGHFYKRTGQGVVCVYPDKFGKGFYASSWAADGKGVVRWLRPDYQIPRFGRVKAKQEQIEADLGIAPVTKIKQTFPAGAVEQTAAVMAALADSPTAVTADELAQNFKQGKKAEARIAATLSSLARTGFISVGDGGKKFSLRRAA